jgi:PAS domain S-box-containing protein
MPRTATSEVIDEEVDWDKTTTILSKTNHKGIIEYCNEGFCNVSGYSDEELMGSNHNIVRHPDMPKVLFQALWDCLKNDQPISAIVKNKSKSGRYYWVQANFKTLISDGDRYYFSVRTGVTSDQVSKVEGLYKKLLEIEKSEGTAQSEAYLTNFLKEHNTTYNDLIISILS